MNSELMEHVTHSAVQLIVHKLQQIRNDDGEEPRVGIRDSVILGLALLVPGTSSGYVPSINFRYDVGNNNEWTNEATTTIPSQQLHFYAANWIISTHNRIIVNHKATIRQLYKSCYCIYVVL
jgi:hypothetical protein